jgi:hypothetical protein
LKVLPFRRFATFAGISAPGALFGFWPECHGKEGVAGSGPAEGSPPNADDPDNFPRVALLNASSFRLWAVVGDCVYDRGAPELAGPNGKLTDDEIRGATSRGVGAVQPLSAQDRNFAFSSTVYAWTRMLPLSRQHYVTLYVFSGGAARFTSNALPPAVLAGIAGSLACRDHS